MTNRAIYHVESEQTIIPAAKWCHSYLSKLRGMTFRRSLAEDGGLVLVDNADGRVNSGITMLFTVIDLGVVWVNDGGEVVGMLVARPWRLSYLPPEPARYVIEGHPTILDKIKLGDHIEFKD
jgi:uncharacterized membrane protein (UPF0127 family)